VNSSLVPDVQFGAGNSLERKFPLERKCFCFLAAIALIYAFLAGLRTVTDFDLGWQLATGRWAAQHHQVPSTDVFSYTAQGQPWIYPIGSGLLLYATYLLGGYALLSWLGAAVCVGTLALLLRRGSGVCAILAILAVPLIADRTTPRADMFTVVLFAAFLTLLWQQHEEGRTPLWLLPLLMIAWVNLHLGFIAGLALLGGYVLVEALELLWPERRRAAIDRLRRFWPWLLATVAATLVNPWGWGLFGALLRQESVTALHSQAILEWYAFPDLSWGSLAATLSLRHPDTVILLLPIAGFSALVALLRRQAGAALLLVGAALLGVRHIRFQALFGLVVVVIAGSVLTAALEALVVRLGRGAGATADTRIRSILAAGAACFVVLLVCVWSADVVSGRTYLDKTSVVSFGTGLGWWFPEGGAAFVERENLPGRLFNSYNEGGFVMWRLGLGYRNYIDGRAIPFGAGLLEHNLKLMSSPPESLEWQREAERYGITTIFVPLGRYYALDSFPMLDQFCASNTWRPVYLDEVSAVFVRRRPETEDLIQRLQIDCATAPVPASVPADDGTQAFNQWANAAAVLNALGRTREAFAATTRALAIFPESAFVHFTRGDLLQQAGNVREAERQYLIAEALEPNDVCWARLAALYRQEGRFPEATQAWSHLAAHRKR
jgi:hypothetical protein